MSLAFDTATGSGADTTDRWWRVKFVQPSNQSRSGTSSAAAEIDTDNDEAIRVPPVRTSSAATQVDPPASVASVDRDSIDSAKIDRDSAKIDRLERLAAEELFEYGMLSAGWDGYSAPEFQIELVSLVEDFCGRACKFFRSVQVVPEDIIPGPVSDGSIDLQILLGDKEIIFTFHPDQEDVGVYTRQDASENEFTAKLTGTELAKYLSWLAS